VKLARQDAEGSDKLCSLRVCQLNDEIVMSTMKGAVTRQQVADISVQSRMATGVKVRNIERDDSIKKVDVIPYMEKAENLLMTTMDLVYV
jgi:DNA gyrase/topoisomerase IV subunit A